MTLHTPIFYFTLGIAVTILSLAPGAVYLIQLWHQRSELRIQKIMQEATEKLAIDRKDAVSTANSLRLNLGVKPQ